MRPISLCFYLLLLSAVVIACTDSGIEEVSWSPPSDTIQPTTSMRDPPLTNTPTPYPIVTLTPMVQQTVTTTPTLQPTETNTPTPDPTETSEPTPIGGGSRIAFTSNRDGNFEIYIMNSDGSNQTRLTNSPDADDFFPVLYHGGEALLFWSHSDVEPTFIRLCWVMSDGSEEGIFIENVGSYSAISSLGLVAITIYDDFGHRDIGGVSLGGGEIVQLTDHPGDDTMPSWSPDGKTISFVSNRDGLGTAHIYLMDWDGENQRRLTENDMIEIEPAWSPDGSRIAFTVVDENEDSNIYIIDTDGTNLYQLTNGENSYNEHPVWSPDGKMIAFWSNRTGNFEIFAVRTDGSGLVNLTNNPADDENPTWSK